MDLTPILKEAVAGVMSVMGALLAIWYRERWLNRNKPTLKESAERIKQVENILSEIQFELEAYRVQEWIVTNGDKTLTGHSIQKLSIFAEFNRNGVESVAPTFQYIPATNLSRNIVALAEANNGYVVSNEYLLDDDLAKLHSSFNIKTIAFFKIVNNTGKWVGILSVAFDQPRDLTQSEVSFLKLKASQLGVI